SLRYRDYDFGAGSIIGVVRGDQAPMRLNDAFGDRHSESRPLRLRGVKRLEDSLLLLGGESGALIAHGDSDRGLSAEFRLRELHVDLGLLGAGLQRVLQNIAKDLPDRDRIDLAISGQRVGIELQVSIETISRRRQKRPRLLKDRAQI